MQEQNPIITDEQNELKKRATRRLIVAVVLVVAAVTILTVLSKKKPPAPIATEIPARIADTPLQPEAIPPLTPEPALPPGDVLPAEETPTPPEVANAAPTPAPPPPPPPQVSAQPTIKTGAQAIPAPKQNITPLPQKPLIQAQPTFAAPAQPAPAKPVTPKPIAQPAANAPVSEQPAPATPTKPQPVLTQPAPIQPKAYAVQLGVFSNPTNAIQLQEKLAQHGIKSYTETRVHVGPFTDKAEADQAMAKIRALGIGAVVVPQR